jgi:hypothetical protein
MVPAYVGTIRVKFEGNLAAMARLCSVSVPMVIPCFEGARKMGCGMKDVVKLVMREPVRVDPDRLVELCVSLGEMRAEALITTAMEELARGMVEVENAYLAQNMDSLIGHADRLVKTSENIGMTTFSRVADDVAACGRLREGTPLAATLNRLRRIADRSLSAVWDMQNLPG